MHVIEARNVRDALPKAVKYIITEGDPEDTRLGQALVAPGPVTIHYTHPEERVLISRVRDANPFFHLMEAMWMLAGRNDGAFLDHYITGFSEKYGVGGMIPDAYGYRWRHGLPFDQLEEIVRQLEQNQFTRQCVLQMWGAGLPDLISEFSTKPCNIAVAFRINRLGQLDMTVFIRSNDLIWGACGANAVHFSILQEYIAGRVGLKIGGYWQVTTNLHLYRSHMEMLTERCQPMVIGDLDEYLIDTDAYEPIYPLYPDDNFDSNLHCAMQAVDDIHNDLPARWAHVENPFLAGVVVPMAIAHQLYKKDNIKEAMQWAYSVISMDWRRAACEWLERHDA